MSRNEEKMDSCFRRNDNIRNQVRRLRFEKGEITQQELADMVGVTRQTIIAIEAGKYSPSLILAFKLAQALGAPIESVFQYESGSLPPKGLDEKSGPSISDL